MREIKFRAWDKDERKMYFEAQNTYDYIEGEPTYIPASNFGELLTDSSFVVMQYTGLKDKNGTEIYEGDIIRDKFLFSMAFSTNYYERENVYEVTMPDIYMCWDESQFSSFDDLKEHFAQGDKKLGIEVIGNIYQNPELLDGQE